MNIFTFFWRKEKKKLEEDYQRIFLEKLDGQTAEYLRDLGEMATTVAHSIRNPLAGIRAGAQRVEQKMLSDDANLKYVRFIIREVDRLERLIKNLLDGVRVFGQRLKPNLQITDLNYLLEQVIASLSDEISQKQIKVTKNLDPNVPKMFVDPELMRQVFLNIIYNAFDALSLGERKRLSLSTRVVSSGYLEVRIADSGPGVPAEIKKKLFEPFVTSKSERTGLGLVISQKIVQAHQGKIYLDDTTPVGSGAIFVVQLPIAKKLGSACLERG